MIPNEERQTDLEEGRRGGGETVGETDKYKC